MNATRSPRHRQNTPERCQGNTARRTLTGLALTVAALMVATTAQAGTLFTHTHQAPAHAAVAPFCYTSIENGAITVAVQGLGAEGSPVTATVTNKARTQTATLTGVIDSGYWQHRVWHTYTSAEIVKAAVAGHACRVLS